MLLQLTVENFRSISDEVELSKSNLIEALQVARRLVVHGTSSKDERLGVQPFLLDAARQGQAIRRAEQLLQATPPGQRWPSFPGTNVHMILDDLQAARLLPETDPP